jgi:hypothetical protein
MHGDQVAGAIQFLRAGQAGRARAHHSHGLARSLRRQLRLDPAFFETAVNDGTLVDLDGDRRSIDAEHA